MSTVPDRLRRWERLAPLSGVLAVLLWVIGIAIIEGGTDIPDEDAGPQVFATYYDEESGRVLGGAFVFMLGSAIFLWFLASLRARIHWAEGDVGRIASIVFAAGIVTAAMSLGLQAPEAAAAFAADNIDPGLDPGAAQALGVLGDGFFIAAEASVAVFFLAAALAGLRTRALPVWLAWASLVLGIAALLPWVGWAVFIWGLPLWVLIAAVWFFLRPAAPARTEPEPLVP
jgi:hypothetical protein